MSVVFRLPQEYGNGCSEGVHPDDLYHCLNIYLENFKSRAQHFFQRVRFDLKLQAANLFIHAFAMGEFERMEAGRLTGLSERAARDVLASLIPGGFLISETPRGKVRVGFPAHALGSLLPNLYPAGDIDKR